MNINLIDNFYRTFDDFTNIISWLAKTISFVFGATIFGIGIGTFYLSNNCGVRSSDLLGVLSQILPEKSKDIRPVVCKAS